jgi:hypothetical protein
MTAPANRFEAAARIMSNESLREFATMAGYRGYIARAELAKCDRQVTFA